MSTVDRTLQKAMEYHRAGDLARAIKCYRQAARQRPGNAGVWYNLGSAEDALGNRAAAVRCLRRAVDAAPDDPTIRRRLSRALLDSGDPDAAVALWQDATNRTDDAAEPWVELARVQLELHRADEAAATFAEAQRRDPDNADVTAELARLLHRLGRVDDAEAQLRSVLDRHPDHPAANVQLASIERRRNAADRAQQRLERVMQTADDALAVGRAGGELAMLYEAQQAFDRAFAAAEQGQAALWSRLSPSQQNVQPILNSLQQMREVITAERIAGWDAPPDDQPPPIFLVGFPRTGTTLIEQMLAAHGGFMTSDEQPMLQLTKEAIADRCRVRGEYPVMLDKLSARHITTLRTVYREHAERLVGDGDARLVDKQPLNTADLCLVRRLFPDAPVIVSLRDPRDTCLSCYFQSFTGGSPMFFDLQHTARYYAAMMDLWLQYRKVLGLPFIEVRYEDVIADPQTAAQAMLAFLDIPWNDAVVRFFEPQHRRYVSTPSFSDVAQPIYARAVGRWTNYRAQLAPVLSILEPYVAAFGYES